MRTNKLLWVLPIALMTLLKVRLSSATNYLYRCWVTRKIGTIGNRWIMVPLRICGEFTRVAYLLGKP